VRRKINIITAEMDECTAYHYSAGTVTDGTTYWFSCLKCEIWTPVSQTLHTFLDISLYFCVQCALITFMLLTWFGTCTPCTLDNSQN